MSHEILQIIPAPKGLRCYHKEETRTYYEPIACLALVRGADNETSVFGIAVSDLNQGADVNDFWDYDIELMQPKDKTHDQN